MALFGVVRCSVFECGVMGVFADFLDCARCTRAHKEWFNTSKKRAIGTVIKWQSWMDFQPCHQDESGRLKGFWRDLLPMHECYSCYIFSPVYKHRLKGVSYVRRSGWYHLIAVDRFACLKPGAATGTVLAENEDPY